jgi:hypothetical protein
MNQKEGKDIWMTTISDMKETKVCSEGRGDNSRYRHEYKYEIDRFQLEALKQRLASVMRLDPHVGRDGMYRIRSLYFDDWYDGCFNDNEDGVDPREKFRIRIYNGRSDRISLELKRKESGMTLKRSCAITPGLAQWLVDGGRLQWGDCIHPLLRKLYIMQETRGMAPKVIVEYVRIPFVCGDGNVRVTLDIDICTSKDIGLFFSPEINSRLVMPVGMSLLEVKYDSLLPDYIYRMVQMNGMRHITFSKYYLCRKFGGTL